jgi:hypothetical protein
MVSRAARKRKIEKTEEMTMKRKKTVYGQWEMKRKFGVDFDPDKIFCYGCKPGDMPLKVGMAECPVRVCSMADGLESCVQCLDLAACDKAFWARFFWQRTKGPFV